jgi:hypothetical protein
MMGVKVDDLGLLVASAHFHSSNGADLRIRKAHGSQIKKIVPAGQSILSPA